VFPVRYKFCILLTGCICVFRMVLTINSALTGWALYWRRNVFPVRYGLDLYIKLSVLGHYLMPCSSNYNEWPMFSSFCCSVKSKRRFVGPNPGFVLQLRLYETMKWQVDKANVQFRMYRLQVAANQVKKGTS
jgi:hypothetical protein